jgi:hypothetical protein
VVLEDRAIVINMVVLVVATMVYQVELMVVLVVQVVMATTEIRVQVMEVFLVDHMELDMVAMD